MKPVLKSLLACVAIALFTTQASLGQVMAKETRLTPFGNPNQLPTTASSLQMLNEMLQYLPADLPACAQNFNTFDVLVTEHQTARQPLSGRYSPNSLAFKRAGQLAFELNMAPLGATAANTGWQAYRVFVENGLVCVSRGGAILARNVQVQKISTNVYCISWYSSSGVVTVTFGKKKDSLIC